MFHMSNDDAGSYGPNLYAYLAEHWRALGTNQNAWCDAHPGIHAPTVSRWRTGTEPRLPAFRTIAEALGVPVVDVLVAAGVLQPDEVGGRTPAQPTTATLDLALRTDPDLSVGLRKAVRDIVRAWRTIEAGEADEVSDGKVRKGRKR